MTAGRKPKTERNNQILNLRLSGLSYAKIAAEYGLTKGRVFQICRDLLKKSGDA